MIVRLMLHTVFGADGRGQGKLASAQLWGKSNPNIGVERDSGIWSVAMSVKAANYEEGCAKIVDLIGRVPSMKPVLGYLREARTSD